MKKVNNIDKLSRKYFRRLLQDVSIEDKMKFFTRAGRIFNLAKGLNKKRAASA